MSSMNACMHVFFWFLQKNYENAIKIIYIKEWSGWRLNLGGEEARATKFQHMAVDEWKESD